MIIDRAGYRLNVGIILVNESGKVFWGKRARHDAWQFPQGGLAKGEKAVEAMYRELTEEIGLCKEDVEILGVTKRWLRYKLPEQYLRYNSNPLVIGQKQKWYLLKLIAPESKICLNSSTIPEFDNWRWVDYDEPQKSIIFFKRQVYADSMQELANLLKKPRVFNTRGSYFKRSSHKGAKCLKS